LALVKTGISQSNVPGKNVSPILNFSEKFIVYFGGPFFGAFLFDVTVKRTFEDRVQNLSGWEISHYLRVEPRGTVRSVGHA
jgi:hypothetical protein